MTQLDRWLGLLRELKGSDLFLVPGLPPSVRVAGQVMRQSGAALEATDIEEAVLAVLPPHAVERYRTQCYADSALRVAGVGRFRLNLHRERGRPAAAIRALPDRPFTNPDRNFQSNISQLSSLSRGLVLIGGPAGSGKTTTVAALVNEINRREAKHIITIEDPVEYEHTHQNCIVEQMEIGVDALDFPTALRSCVRQSPDVIVVGEMRDPETMRMALGAAETGHLVLSTIHTSDVIASVSRIADSFPAERQPTIRQELSMAVAAVLTQKLLPCTRGGRIPAAELLMVSYGARQHIRKNALQHLHQEMTTTRSLGSFTLEESLAALVKAGLVRIEDARACAIHGEDLDALLRPGL